QNVKIDGKFNIDMEKSALNTKGLKLTIGEAPFLLSADALFKDKPHADVNLELADSNVGQLLAFEPKIAAAVTKDLSKDIYKVPVSINLGINYDNDLVSIKKAALSFGGTKLNASGTVSAIGKMPAELAINISPVKLSELKKLTQALAPAEGVADPDLKLKVSGPLMDAQKISVSGHIETDKIKYLDYEISKLKADFGYGGSKASLSALSGNLYDGTLSGSGSVRLLGEPAYEASVNISGVNMSKIPATKDILKGTGTLKVNASGKGTDSAAIKKNLKASGNIFLADGDIPSLKLGEKIFGNSSWQILANAGVGLNKEALNELKSLDASCKNFSSSFNMENGVITTPDVKWQHAKYRVTLSGSVSMDENLDYNGEFALLKPTTNILIENQTAKAILTNKAGELAVPFDVKGTASAPKVSPDEKYLTSLFGKAVKEIALKEVQQKVIGPAIKETGKKLLEGIFGK
ncbi:MAG: AsmA family protein, partial [Deltaproteobacteria bacterium]|nr:AsmA family protein [Deltaproteobacteria bacterium]